MYRAKKKLFQTLFLSLAKFEQIWPTYAVKFKTGNIEQCKIYILCSRIEKICSKSITDYHFDKMFDLLLLCKQRLYLYFCSIGMYEELLTCICFVGYTHCCRSLMLKKYIVLYCICIFCIAIVYLHICLYLLAPHVVIFMYNLSVSNKLKL